MSRRMAIELRPPTAGGTWTAPDPATLGGTLNAYSMRMARVNITVPDNLLGLARAADLNISRLTAAALHSELDRLAKVAALERYLGELEAELGPIPPEEAVAAQQWADRVLGGSQRTDLAG